MDASFKEVSMIRIIFATVTCAALSFWSFCLSGTNKSTELEIECPDTSHLATGEGVLTYKSRNPSDKVVQLIGIKAGCGDNCCINPVDLHLPIIIPGHSQYDLTLPCLVRSSGSYELQAALYYEKGRNTKSLPFVVTGYSAFENTVQP